MTAPDGRRASIASALDRLPKGEWVTIEAFEEYLLASGCEFEVSRDTWRLYILDPEYGSLGYGDIPVRELVERRYLMAFLFEYAATLGLIDLAYTYPNQVDQSRLDELWGTMDLAYLSRYDGLLQFRLNDLGAYVLGRTKRYTASAPRPTRYPDALPEESPHDAFGPEDADDAIGRAEGVLSAVKNALGTGEKRTNP